MESEGWPQLKPRLPIWQNKMVSSIGQAPSWLLLFLGSQVSPVWFKLNSLVQPGLWNAAPKALGADHRGAEVGKLGGTIPPCWPPPVPGESHLLPGVTISKGKLGYYNLCDRNFQNLLQCFLLWHPPKRVRTKPQGKRSASVWGTGWFAEQWVSSRWASSLAGRWEQGDWRWPVCPPPQPAPATAVRQEGPRARPTFSAFTLTHGTPQGVWAPSGNAEASEEQNALSERL